MAFRTTELKIACFRIWRKNLKGVDLHRFLFCLFSGSCVFEILFFNSEVSTTCRQQSHGYTLSFFLLMAATEALILSPWVWLLPAIHLGSVAYPHLIQLWVTVGLACKSCCSTGFSPGSVSHTVHSDGVLQWLIVSFPSVLLSNVISSKNPNYKLSYGFSLTHNTY